MDGTDAAPESSVPAPAGWERILAAAAAVMLVLAGWHLLVDATRTWDYNAVRLQRSFVLAAGESIYPGRDSGPILNAIYGPVGAVAYLPATVLRTPASAVLAGQALSLLIFFAPLAALLLGGERGRPRAPAVFGMLLFAALTVDLRPLEYVAFTVHVDAPALALALAAWSALGAADDTRGFLRASLFAALAVWTKLMALPLLAAMPAWALLTGGWRRALRLAACLAVVLALVSVAMVLVFGPADRLAFNMWTVPSRQTLGEIGEPGALLRGAWRLLRENVTAWALWSAVLVARLAGGAPWRREPAVACGFVGLALAPFAVFGLLKAGGDVNALSYPAYFVLAGAVLSAVEAARRSVLVRRLLAVIPAVVMAVVLAVQEPELLDTWKRGVGAAELPHQIAYEYALRHPGEVYFPRITLASLLAEGRVYHQSVGLLDRELAGFPPSPAHLWAYLPPRLRAVAFYDNAFASEVDVLGLPELGEAARDAELPGFLVYRVR